MHPISHSEPTALRHYECPPQPPTVLSELAEDAGIRFNGSAPWDIHVHETCVYDLIFSEGAPGFGEPI